MHAPLRLLLPLALAAFNTAQACSCFGPLTFCSTLNPQPPQFPEPQWWIPSDIVLVVKLNNYEYAADVKVVRTFRGDLQENDLIRVWGDCGLLCRHYVGGPASGDTLLWALQPCDLSGNGSCGTSFEEAGDYQLSGCGIYWLGYENGVISGPLTTEGQTETIHVDAFQSFVDGCLPTGIEDPERLPAITVNYVNNTPMIAWAGTGVLDLEVLDMHGRMVFRRTWDGSLLPLTGYSPGVFLVNVRRGQEKRTVRIALL